MILDQRWAKHLHSIIISRYENLHDQRGHESSTSLRHMIRVVDGILISHFNDLNSFTSTTATLMVLHRSSSFFRGTAFLMQPGTWTTWRDPTGPPDLSVCFYVGWSSVKMWWLFFSGHHIQSEEVLQIRPGSGHAERVNLLLCAWFQWLHPAPHDVMA